MARDANRLNNFDNLVFIQARSPNILLEELRKIEKAASILSIGPMVGEIGHYAYIEILAKGSKRKVKVPEIEKSQETKTEIIGE